MRTPPIDALLGASLGVPGFELAFAGGLGREPDLGPRTPADRRRARVVPPRD